MVDIGSDVESGQTVYASLSFYGKELDPDAISSVLDLEPARAFRRGDTRGRNSHWPHGYWSYSSRYQIQSADLGMHVHYLVEILRQKREGMRRARAMSDSVRVYGFAPVRGGLYGVRISPEDMIVLGELNIFLDFDIAS